MNYKRFKKYSVKYYLISLKQKLSIIYLYTHIYIYANINCVTSHFLKENL